MKLTWGALLYEVMNPLFQQCSSSGSTVHKSYVVFHPHSADLMVRGQEGRMEECHECWDNCVISNFAEPAIRRITR